MKTPLSRRPFTGCWKRREASAVPIYLCPELITYGRRREKEEESLINIFFGQSDTTDPIRRVITFLRYSNKASVISAEPVNLAEYMKAGGDRPREELVRQLREELIARIDEEKTTIVGPILKSRKRSSAWFSGTRALVTFMEETAAKAKKGKRDAAAVRKEARKYLEEIASDYSDIFIEIWEKILYMALEQHLRRRGGGWRRHCEDPAGIQEDAVRHYPLPSEPFRLSSAFIQLLQEQHPDAVRGGRDKPSFFPMEFISSENQGVLCAAELQGKRSLRRGFCPVRQGSSAGGLPWNSSSRGRSRTGKMVMPKYGLPLHDPSSLSGKGVRRSRRDSRLHRLVTG